LHHHVPTATSTADRKREGERTRSLPERIPKYRRWCRQSGPKNGDGDVERRCRAAMWSGDVVLSSPQMFLPSGSYRLVHLHLVVLRSPPVRSLPAA
jgi:hypothetical protein